MSQTALVAIGLIHLWVIDPGLVSLKNSVLQQGAELKYGIAFILRIVEFCVCNTVFAVYKKKYC